jgi:hypothetical protein
MPARHLRRRKPDRVAHHRSFSADSKIMLATWTLSRTLNSTIGAGVGATSTPPF